MSMRATRCVLVFLAAGTASAQVFSFGLKAGISLNSLLKSASPRFHVTTHHYTLGPTLELKLPYRLAFEADLLYKRLEYRYARTGSITQTSLADVKIDRWELPVLFKYTFVGRGRPFVDLGGSFNRVVHIDGVNVAELRHRHTRGLVLGAGADRRIGIVRIAPEIRFTHWADRNFGVHDAPLRSNLTQAEILVGFTF